MFDKSFLVNKLVNSLVSNEFRVFLSEGAFDIAARKKFLMLVKALINIDSLNQEQALSLRSISYFLSAHPLVVSVKTNREFLNDSMVYSRFKLPVITPETFEEIVSEDSIKAVESAKGRYTVEIDVKNLREKRNRMQMSLSQLADIVGISKKALYEIENKRVNPSLETVEKLEATLKVELKSDYSLKSPKETLLKPKTEFQRKVSKEFYRIGIANSPVYSSPFEIVGKEKFSLITSLSKNTKKIIREAKVVKGLSRIFYSEGVFVTKDSHEDSVDGIPVILEKELPEIDSAREFTRMLKEKKS